MLAVIFEVWPADSHATNRENLFYLSVTHRESVIELYSVTEYSCRESIAIIDRDLIIHALILNGSALS